MYALILHSPTHMCDAAPEYFVCHRDQCTSPRPNTQAYPECVACGRREHTRFKNMSAIERQFWTEDEEGRCMCWKCHGVYKQRLERDSALTRSSLGRSSVGSSSAAHEAAHVPSQEV